MGRHSCIVVAADTQADLVTLVGSLRAAFRDEDRDTAILLLSGESDGQRPDPRHCGNPALKDWMPLTAEPRLIRDILDNFAALPQIAHCPGPNLVQISGEGWKDHRRLLRAGFRGNNGISVKPLLSGKSGAFVGIVKVVDAHGHPLPQPLVVKIRAERKLMAELTQLDEIAWGYLPDHSYLPIKDSLYDEAERKTMLVMRAVLDGEGNVTTLRSLYPGGPDRVLPVTTRVLENISSWTQRARQQPYSIISPYLGKAHEDVDRRAVLQRRLVALALVKTDFLEDFEDWANSLGIEASKFGRAHGDLHGDNILMAADGSPRIIDFSRGGTSQHVAGDMATLTLDVLWRAMETDAARNVIAHALMDAKAETAWATPMKSLTEKFAGLADIDPTEFWTSVMLMAASNLSYEDVDRRAQLEALLAEAKTSIERRKR
jgi:hypothetical protein